MLFELWWSNINSVQVCNFCGMCKNINEPKNILVVCCFRIVCFQEKASCLDQYSEHPNYAVDEMTSWACQLPLLHLKRVCLKNKIWGTTGCFCNKYWKGFQLKLIICKSNTSGLSFLINISNLSVTGGSSFLRHRAHSLHARLS